MWIFQRGKFLTQNGFKGDSLISIVSLARPERVWKIKQRNFFLAVEAELKRRAEVNKLSRGDISLGVKGLRELKGLFSSINYGSTSARQSGTNRARVLSVDQ